jgi:hypothetical protein
MRDGVRPHCESLCLLAGVNSDRHDARRHVSNSKWGDGGTSMKPSASRNSIVASSCLAALMTAWLASPLAAQALDTSRIPRAPGAKEIYASPLTTIYTAPEPVAEAVAAASKALAAEGWREYAIPNTAQADNPTTKLLFFKKGPQAMSMLVTLAPGQTAIANVNYGVKPVANDLPVPADAADLAFDGDKPYLSCVTNAPVAAAMDFFGKELVALGWAAADGVKPGITETRAHAYFVRDGRSPLLLTLVREDGKTKVELQGVPPDYLVAERQQGKPAPAPTPAPAPVAAAKVEKAPEAADADVDAMLKQAQQLENAATAEALSAPGKGKGGGASPDGPAEALSVLPGDEASIPLPSTAEDIEFDGAEGNLEFNSSSTVKSLAAFFRGAMKPLGWSEHPSVINKSNMVELEFSKAGKHFDLTIMQLGPKANVTGRGEGLVNSAAKPDAEASANAPAAPAELEAEDQDGFPVPANHTMSGTETTPFRHGLTADVPANMADVLAFYRRELGKRDWKEQTAGTLVKPDQAVVAFASPNGPAILKLVHKADDTSISLVMRDTDKAAKGGMLPKPGQARVMFGNTLGAEAVITINKQNIKVAAGAGSKGPDGPKLDLAPGKYKISVKMAGQPAKADEMEIAADEAWGVLIGPGGLLPLQMY